MKRSFPVILALLTVLVVPTMIFAAGGSGFPTWSQHLTKGRFTVSPLFGGAAVFDKETGLLWEQSPDTGTFTWFNALEHCYPRNIGDRAGWRLPTIEELASLVDTSSANPALPAGHPFTGVTTGTYWSATSNAGTNSFKWVVSFDNGGLSAIDKTATFLAWCVRGGQGVDGVQ